MHVSTDRSKHPIFLHKKGGLWKVYTRKVVRTFLVSFQMKSYNIARVSSSQACYLVHFTDHFFFWNKLIEKPYIHILASIDFLAIFFSP